MRNDEYSSLPLAMSANGLPRNPLSFIYLQPGVQSVGRWGNVMGGQDFSTDVYLEGIAITDPVQQGEGRNITQGISVEAGWAKGADGVGTKMIDIERGWLTNHEDLPSGIQLLDGRIRKESIGHGTAVLGEIVALDNTTGVVGIAPRTNVGNSTGIAWPT